MDVVLYIWDQYIIGLDAPGFHDEFLPAVMAIYLMLVKENLRGAETVRSNAMLAVSPNLIFSEAGKFRDSNEKRRSQVAGSPISV
jgi:hypothetical protein